MKIVVISTTILTVPLKGYGGLEDVAYQQAIGLAKLGHQVLLVAPVGSTVPAGVELHGTTLGEAEAQAFTGYAHRLKDWEVVIDNSWEKWAYMGKIEGQLKIPVMGVLHAPAGTMYRKPPPMPRPCMICISHDQAEEAKEIWKIDTRVAHNGVDMNFYKPMPEVKRGTRYLFLARFSKIKGAHIALDVAEMLAPSKVPIGLDLVGDDKITGEPDYAKECVERAGRIPGAIYHGGATREKCVEWFNGAKAMLHMNQLFREPFGLAPVEAQMCGCPVIAWDNGAMRETIKHGETGFLVKSVEEVIELVKTNVVKNLKPERCREWASQFSIENMVKRYEELCKEAIEGGW
jgi:glycosyltransferase involved in cell wall biosynthesis